jgi:hypothetical protein
VTVARREILKKLLPFSAWLTKPTNLTLTYQFIQVEEANFPVRLLCKILNVSKISYYTYRNGAPFTQSDSNLT